ncbi:MAG: chromate transporter [Sphaerochaetaceae bacterium]|nr:chromate transporter [Sphaerochaetaceae bacterium]
MNILTDLFITFAKIGSFTFGGGFAMISLIENSCVSEKKWISHDELMNVTVLAQSTPGPIAINCATYVGYKKAGLIGAIVATIGMVLPSFLIILLISNLLDNFLEISWVQKAFMGIKLAVGVLILDAGITMIAKMKNKKALTVSILLLSFVAMLATNFFSLGISSIVIMLLAALISLSASLGGNR